MHVGIIPHIESRFSDSQCAAVAAYFNILKSKATALARAEIAMQAGIPVKAVDKSHDELEDALDGRAVVSTFSRA